jgi:outer membrane immunogenic protein
MIKRIGLWATAAATGAVMLSTAALAADMPVKAPPPVVVAGYNWTGFYIGVHAGAAFWARSTVLDEFYDSTNGTIPLPSTTSFLGGGQAGYNWQHGRLVLGVEGDLSYLRRDTRVRSPFQPADTDYFVKSSYFATARGRLGYAADRGLLYVTGGAAFSNIEYTVLDALNIPAGGLTGNRASGSARVNHGWVLGGGGEYAISNNWTVKGEYLYARFDGPLVTATLAAPPGATSNFQFSEQDIHVLRFGLNYRFGAPVVARY